MSTHHSTKARHYAALASGIKNLNANLGETEELFGMMSQQLLYMRQLAITNGSQCVAAVAFTAPTDLQIYGRIPTSG